MIYTEIISMTKNLAGIDMIGIVSAPGQTAVCFSGTKTLKTYLNGSKKESVLLQISGMDTTDRQQELIDRLCGIGKILEKSKTEIAGIEQGKYRISSLPIPTMHDGKHWIFSMTISFNFYTRKDVII